MPVAQIQGQEDGEQVHEDQTGDMPRTASVMSSASARSGLHRVNSSGMYSAQDVLQEEEDRSVRRGGHTTEDGC